ncbi:MAG TPA: prolyl aminopeptidase [Kiloniellaceae bacterium]|nr:prolyl aminopeptidase [Kiloniellaceae bacterium]
MSPLYPEIEPHAEGMLAVGDGNSLYWEVSGNPRGLPVVALHGGPGSGSSSRVRRFFDPRAYRIVLFDQRGCGRSRPHASTPGIDLSVNTTSHLVGDMERLRRHLGVEGWLLFGHSWGTTLALAYAQAERERVLGLVLVGVTTTRRSEIDWLYRGLARFFPEEWARFRDGVPEDARDGDLIEAYYRLVNDPDPAVCAKAARDWHDWEAASMKGDPAAKPPARWSDPGYLLARTRIITHYFHHNAWLEEGALLRGAAQLAGTPGAVVQGRLDLEAPPLTAWELARAWPDAELHMVASAGHSHADPGLSETIIAVTDRFAGETPVQN